MNLLKYIFKEITMFEFSFNLQVINPYQSDLE